MDATPGAMDGGARSQQRPLAVVRGVAFLAVGAQATHQALGDDRHHVAGEDGGTYAHVVEAGKYAQGGVGMQGGEHQMAGHGGAESHLGRLAVADLAHQDDVRILPHDGPHAAGEIHLGQLGEGGLADQGVGVLHRVFQGHDVDLFPVQVGQQGIQGGGLARTGGAGDDDHALGAGDGIQQAFQGGFRQAHAFQGDDGLFPVEDPQHDVLAMQGGQAGYPEVDGAAIEGEGQAAVLGGAGFGDVEAGDDLEAHRDGGPVFPVQAAHGLQHAVDAVADAQERGFRLEVHVRRAALDRLGQQGIDQAHHGLGVLGAHLQAAPVHLAGLDLLENAVHGQVEAVELVQVLEDLGLGGQHRLDVVAAFQVGAQLVQGDQVEQVGHRHGQRVAIRVDRQRQDMVTPGQVFRRQGDGLRVGHHLGEVDAGLAGIPGEHVAQHRVVDETQFDQLPSQGQAADGLLREGDAQLIVTDQALGGEPFTKLRGFGEMGHLVGEG